MTKLQSALKEFGLNNKESQVYLTLLPLSSVTASALSYRTGIKRSTAQYICQRLEEKGLLTSEKRGNAFYYKSKSPSQILYLLDQEKKNLDKKVERANHLVGELNALVDSNSLPANNWVKFYSNPDGVAKAYMDFIDGISKGDEICNYVSPAPITMMQIRRGMRHFIKQRIQKQIFCKTICANCEDAVRLKITDDYSFRKTLISFENIPWSFFSEILLSKDSILGASYSGGVCFAYLMVDKDIAAMHLAVFNLAWRQAALEDAKLCQTKKIKAIMAKLRGIRDY